MITKPQAMRPPPPPPLPPLHDPLSRQSLTFPDLITQQSQTSTVSSLASSNTPERLIKIGEGKYVSSHFKPLHSDAIALEGQDKVKAGKGSYGEFRTKRGRCRICKHSAGYTCSICGFCICQPGHKSGRDCFRDHVRKYSAIERHAHWDSLQTTMDI